jgi:hypothetical protein
VRTVGVCTDGHGRGTPAACSGSTCARAGFVGRFDERVDGVALIGHRLPVPIGDAGLDDIRRTQPPYRRPVPYGATSPRHRGSRNAHGVRRHRPACGAHARADFTSPHTCWSARKCTWDVPLCAACTFYRPRPGLVSSGGSSTTWATRAGRAHVRRVPRPCRVVVVCAGDGAGFGLCDASGHR